MVTGVDTVTVLVLIANVVLDVPAGTVTVAGTVADGSELLSDTTAPPLGAQPFRVTGFPDSELPPITELLNTPTLDTAVGDTVMLAVAVTPPAVAEIVTAVAVATVDVVMLKTT